MSEQDKVAIEIIEKMQSRIQKWAIVIFTTFAITLLSAVFWAGNKNYQINNNTKTGITNTENIEKLTDLIKDFASEQKVANESYIKKDQYNKLIDYQISTMYNLGHIAYWAETKGYKGLPRNSVVTELNKEED